MRFLFAVIVFSTCAVASADVSLPSILSNNMVLQQGVKIPIWGTASAGENVSVSIGDNHAEATADAGGNWKCFLDPMPPGDQPAEMTVRGKNSIAVRNILIGEVWFCAGQSNMGWTLSRSKDAEKEIAEANYPSIRLYRGGQWMVCNPKNAGPFSAVAYYFGRHIHRELHRPVGLLMAGIGGTSIEQWTSMDAFENDPTLSEFPDMIREDIASFDEEKAKHDQKTEKWRATTQAIVTTRPALARAQPGNGLPYAPKALVNPKDWYGGIHAGTVERARQMAIAGVLWYQGENNVGMAERYSRLFPSFIRHLRKDFGREDLPFLFVQLPNLGQPASDPNRQASWAELRAVQAQALSIPNTFMVVTIDVGEAKNVHPPDKLPVGTRLAVAALATVYDRKPEGLYSSPMFESMKVDGSKVIVKFKNADGGLITTDGQNPTGFAIAGADERYFWADATIDGESVMLTTDKVPFPATVRYAWADNPKVNLCNRSNLPAAPFMAGEEFKPVDRRLVSSWKAYMTN